MKRIPVSMFRVALANYEEEVEVTVQGRTLGIWTPASLASRGAMYTPEYIGNTSAPSFTAVSDNVATTVGPASTGTISRAAWDGFGSSKAAPKPKK